MSGITHMWWIRVVDLFTFSHGGNWNKQGGCVPLMWLVALSSGLVVIWCGHVVKPIECIDVLVECECLWGGWSARRVGWKVNGIQNQYVVFLTCSVCLLMMGSVCVWGLREGSNFQLEGLKNFKAFSSRRSSLTQIFVESCVDFEVAHLSVFMVRGLPYPEIPTLIGTRNLVVEWTFKLKFAR